MSTHASADKGLIDPQICNTEKSTAEAVEKSSNDSAFQEVRSRAVLCTKYIFWALFFAFLLLIGNAYFSLVQRWLAVLETARQVLGIRPALSGPDWWLVAGLGIAIGLPLAIAVLIYWRYRKHWERRLREVWQGEVPAHAKMHRLHPAASKSELNRRIEYVRALGSALAWKTAAIPDPGANPESYKQTAEAILRELEKDISQRAITVGLLVGVSQNRAVDLLTIASAALELQLHVLTRLGKRPSFSMWREMLTRTASSLFVNSYLNADESLALRIAIKKTGMGLELAADMIDNTTKLVGNHLENAFNHAGQGLDLEDADWDEVDGTIPHSVVTLPIKSLFEAGRLVTGAFVGIGTFGVRQLGAFIDRAGDELFQGALAGGILYFHGMAIAADCLALDECHRKSVGMDWTVRKCVKAACCDAALKLRVAVRTLREALKDKRRRTANFVLEAVAQTLGNLSGPMGHVIKHAESVVTGTLQTAWRNVNKTASAPQSPHAPDRSATPSSEPT